MRPRTQKQPQVKKELCRALDDVDVPYLFIYLFQGLFYIFFSQYTYSLNLIIHYFLDVCKRLD